MRLLTLGAAIASQFCIFAPQAICQESKTQPERLHIDRSFPGRATGGIRAIASTIQRDLSSKESESILQLRGDVEVRMITCALTGRSRHDDFMSCGEGPIVLHADEVDYNEKTGGIDARGNVHIAPYRAVPKKVASK